MATSLQFPSDHHHPENHQAQQAQAMNQSATGRRRSSKNDQKKKKQPQRGMGVEQLERLRVQEQIKNSTIHVGHNQYYSNSSFPNFTPLSSFTGGGSSSASAAGIATTAGAGADPRIYSNSILSSSPVIQFPKLCVNPNDFFMQQKVVNTGFIGSSSANQQVMISSHDHHQFQPQMDLYGFSSSKPSTEKSKELYSVPNLFSSNNSCFSDRCRSCNKKKRMINGGEISIHMEDMIREKEESGKKPLLHPYSLPNRLEKGVEIVAIHRKGSSSASSEEGGVVMEYDFFPAKFGSKSTDNCTSCFEKEATMMSAYNSPESSSIAAAAGNINGEASSVTSISWAADTTTTTPTSSIDLSLKLSC